MKSDAQQTHPPATKLAAFVDGRLPDAERTAVVEHLDACERCYEVVAETMRFLEEEAEEELAGEPGAAPSATVHVLSPREAEAERSGRRTRPRWWVPAAAAAALVAILALPLFRSGISAPPPDLRVAGLVEALSPGANEAEIVARLAGDRGWSVVRSAGPDPVFASDPLHPTQRAFRLGVRQVDLEVALRVGDRSTAVSLARQGAELVRPFDLSQPAVSAYEELADSIEAGTETEELLRLSERAAQRTDRLPEPAFRRFGGWAEAALLAAEGGRLGFFASETSTAAWEARPREGLSPGAAEAVERLDGLLGGGVEPQSRSETRAYLSKLIAEVADPPPPEREPPAPR